MRRIFLAVFIFWGAMPRALNYQGKITDSAGVALNDTLTMVFRLYTSEVGGVPIWVDTVYNVDVFRGLFSVELSGFPDSINFEDGYFLEVEVNGEVFSPRERLVASPYSMRARTVEHAVQAVMRRGGTVAHTGTLVLAEGSGVTITEAGDSIFLFFTSEGGGGGGGGVPLPGFSFGNPFNIACLPLEETISPGLKVYSIVTAVLADPSFSGYVKFSVVGLPFGASAEFEPDSVLPTASSTMIITTSDETPIGSYPLTILGQSADGSVARTLYTLNIVYESYIWQQTTTAQFDENTNINVQTTGDMVWLGMLDLGTGEDGDFHATSNMTLNSGTYNFRTFRIDPGVTVTVQRGTSVPLVIKCLGEVVISGWLDLSGNNGASYSGSYGGAGGLGGPGGYAGGRGGNYNESGQNGFGPGGGGGGAAGGYYPYGGGGGGYGTSGSTGYNGGGSGGSQYGNPQLSVLQGGSGGGGGGGSSYSSYYYGGGGGGGGGGALLMTAQKITINSGGGIRANGGHGGAGASYGYSYNYGGGGSGGAIWLRAEKIINTGSVEARPGGSGFGGHTYSAAGGYGRIRMDCVSYTKSHPFYSDGTISPNVGWSEMPNTYLESGSTVTYVIAPTGIRRWGRLTYTRDVSMSGTSLKVDVLSDDDTVLLSDVSSGTNLHLAGVDASTYPAIKLRATLTTSNPYYSPKLLDWALTYEANP